MHNNNNNDLAKRLRTARTYLKLSQEYVAELLGISRSAVSEIENNKRSVSAEELKKLSEIYGWSADDFLHGRQQPTDSAVMFARTFSELPDEDQIEILNLIEFKKKLRAKQVKHV